MNVHRSIRTVLAVAVFGLAQLGLAAYAWAAPVPTRLVAADVNNPAIDATRGLHHVWLTDEPARRVGKLLVFMGGGGTTNLPGDWLELGNEGRRLGYHTIILAYKNEFPLSALPPAGCGNNVDAPLGSEDCAINARTEILDGSPVSSVVDVDEANSIEGRLTAVLQYLDATYRTEGWSQFLDHSGAEGPAPKWSKTVISGQALGAGQAVLAGMKHSVDRVVLFQGWSDAKHGWVELGMTSPDRHFSLLHARENSVFRTCFAYLKLELVLGCPLPDPAHPLPIDNRQPPFESRQLLFDLPPSPTAPAVVDPFHPSATRDAWIARELDGTPSQKLLNGWRSVLGDSDADTVLDEVDSCPLLATGDHADPDLDGAGNACDPTPYGTTPPTITGPGNITVNATGPAGAGVPYTVSVADDLDPAPNLVCTPPAGSLFAIGDTTVACTATDAGGNTANASFTVSVLGAKAQLINLIRKLVDATNLPAAVRTQLIASLQSFDPNKPLHRAVACFTLRAFTVLVRFVAPPAQAAEWTADANRIRAVLAC